MILAHLALALATNQGAAAADERPAIVQVTPARLFRIADSFRRAGRTGDAEAAYRALATNPDGSIRSEARFRHAQMLSSLGRDSDAAVLLRQILDEQPNANRVRIELAAILARMGDIAAARRQLRAAQAGGLPPEVARMVDRFSAALRARQPVGGSIGFALAPDTNINRGTHSDRLGTVIGDFVIAPDAKAQSGLGIAADAQGFARTELSGNASLLLRGAASARLYRQSDFNDVTAGFGVGPEFALGADRLNLSLSRYRRWFGGERLTDSLVAAVDYLHPAGRKAQVRLGGAATRIDNHFNPLEDGVHWSGSAAAEMAIDGLTGAGANIVGGRRTARDPAFANWALYPGLFGWREVGRATVTASVGLGWLKADERLLLYPEARRDRIVRLSLGGTIRQLTVGGFAPSLQLSIERNRSNIAVYDYNRRALEFGISRAF